MQQHTQRARGGKPYLHTASKCFPTHFLTPLHAWSVVTFHSLLSGGTRQRAPKRSATLLSATSPGSAAAAAGRESTLPAARRQAASGSHSPAHPTPAAPSRSPRSKPAQRSFADRNRGGAAAPLHAGPGAAAMGVVSGPPAAPRGGGHRGRAATKRGPRRADREASPRREGGPEAARGEYDHSRPGPRRTRPRGNRAPASASPRLGRKMEPEPGGHLPAETGAAAAPRPPATATASPLSPPASLSLPLSQSPPPAPLPRPRGPAPSGRTKRRASSRWRRGPGAARPPLPGPRGGGAAAAPGPEEGDGHFIRACSGTGYQSLAGARHKPPVRPWLAPSANRLFGWTENGCEGTSPSAEPRFPQPACPPSAPPPRHARRLFPSARSLPPRCRRGLPGPARLLYGDGGGGRRAGGRPR